MADPSQLSAGTATLRFMGAAGGTRPWKRRPDPTPREARLSGWLTFAA